MEQPAPPPATEDKWDMLMGAVEGFLAELERRPGAKVSVIVYDEIATIEFEDELPSK